MDAIFSYHAGGTLLHKTPAIIKLIFLLLFCAFALGGSGTYNPLIIKSTLIKIFFSLIIALSFWIISRGGLGTIKKLAPVFLLAFSVVVIKVFNALLIDWGEKERLKDTLPLALFGGGLYSTGFILSSFMAIIIFETTSFLEIYFALLAIPLIKKTQIPLLLALSVDFVREAFEIWEKIKVAQRARTPKKLPLSRRIECLTYLLSALIACLLENAKDRRLSLLNKLN